MEILSNGIWKLRSVLLSNSSGNSLKVYSGLIIFYFYIAYISILYITSHVE